MRRALTFGLLVAGTVVYFLRRREPRRERVSLYYADGSMVTLDRRTQGIDRPGIEKVLTLARNALH